MKVGVFTAQQLAALRPDIDAINDAMARRATHIGAAFGNRVPQSYSRGALGWSTPFTFYPQSTGATVVSIEDADWDALPAGVRAQYASPFPLTSYPAGFSDGAAG